MEQLGASILRINQLNISIYTNYVIGNAAFNADGFFIIIHGWIGFIWHMQTTELNSDSNYFIFQIIQFNYLIV